MSEKEIELKKELAVISSDQQIRIIITAYGIAAQDSGVCTKSTLKVTNSVLHYSVKSVRCYNGCLVISVNATPDD